MPRLAEGMNAGGSRKSALAGPEGASPADRVRDGGQPIASNAENKYRAGSRSVYRGAALKKNCPVKGEEERRQVSS
jgi:hypothetical protein